MKEKAKKVTGSGKDFFSWRVTCTVGLWNASFFRIPYSMHTFLSWCRKKEEWRDMGKAWIMVGRENHGWEIRIVPNHGRDFYLI